MFEHRLTHPPSRRLGKAWPMLATMLAMGLAAFASHASDAAPAATPAAATAPAAAAPAAPAKSKSTADHSKFKELQGPFASGSDVT